MLRQSLGTRRYRILIIDDRSLVRTGLRKILDSEPDIAVCGEVLEGGDVVDLAAGMHPDIIFLNPTTPGFDGLEMTRRIRETSPQAEIVVVSFKNGESLARSGACGDGSKALNDDSPRNLVREAVQRLRQRRCLPTDRPNSGLVPSEVRWTSQADTGGRTSLSIREIEVATLLAEGQTNRETAKLLGLSPRTVEAHRNRIMRKMNLSSYSALIRFAIRTGLIRS
jgi:DNA-binding NarL/FixJ family response regulator